MSFLYILIQKTLDVLSLLRPIVHDTSRTAKITWFILVLRWAVDLKGHSGADWPVFFSRSIKSLIYNIFTYKDNLPNSDLTRLSAEWTHGSNLAISKWVHLINTPLWRLPLVYLPILQHLASCFSSILLSAQRFQHSLECIASTEVYHAEKAPTFLLGCWSTRF